MTTTDALKLIAAGRSAEVNPGTRALIRRRGWGWYDPRPPRMVLTPRGKALLAARLEDRV